MYLTGNGGSSLDAPIPVGRNPTEILGKHLADWSQGVRGDNSFYFGYSIITNVDTPTWTLRSVDSLQSVARLERIVE